MKVVSFSLCYPSDETPQAGLFVRERLRALAALVDVRVVHARPTPFWALPGRPGCPQGSPDELPTWRVPMPYLPLLGKPLNPYLYARSVYPLIASWADRGDVDVLDAHFCWPDGVAIARVARRLGLPYTVTLRGLLDRYVHDPTKRWSIIRSLRQAAAVIAVSDSLRQSALHLGADPDRTHVIPNGVDTDTFKPGDRNAARRALGRSTDEMILITVGHLCRRKGVHRVLELLPDLLARDQKIRYVVVGADGAEDRFSAHLRRLTHRLGLQDHVTFTGALNAPQVARWLQAADLFVLATSNEGWCNALYEAVATGLPVVCSDAGGNSEIVTPGAGTTVPFGDTRALFEAIRGMLAKTHDREAIVRSGAIRTWAHVGQETAAVLQSAIAPVHTPVDGAPPIRSLCTQPG